MTIDIFVLAAATVLGLIFGSFGTVAAYRIPQRESVVTGRSKCPHCGHTITAIEKIPLLSYVVQRARCRHCGAPISARYPMIELAVGALFALAAWKFVVADHGTSTTGDWLLAILYAAFFWVLVVLSVIDIEHGKLYDRIVFPAVAASWAGLLLVSLLEGDTGRFSGTAVYALVVTALLVGLALPWGAGSDEQPESDVRQETDPKQRAEERRTMMLFQLFGVGLLVAWTVLLVLSLMAPAHSRIAGAAIGAALFSGFFFAVFLMYPVGMGFGDVKLSLLLGSFLGYLEAPALVLVGLFMSFVCGAVLGAIPRLMAGGGRKAQIPFGPYLALGTVIAICLGGPLLDAYLGLTGA